MYQGFNLQPNYCRFRISPDVTFALGINAMAPESETVSESVEILGRRYPHVEEMDAYERVIGDAMEGDATLFAREDYVEEAWRIVDPALKRTPQSTNTRRIPGGRVRLTRGLCPPAVGTTRRYQARRLALFSRYPAYIGEVYEGRYSWIRVMKRVRAE
jgi:hypothetical protein